MKRAAALLIAIAPLCFVIVASAQEPLELEWDAPKGCPTKEDVLKEVNRIVGSGEVRRHVRAEAKVSGAGDRWSLSLQTKQGGGEGERTLEGHSCKAVASAAALVLALTLQTDAPEPPASASSSAIPPPTIVPPPTAPPPVLAPPKKKLAIEGVMRAGAGVAFATVPGTSVTANASGGIRLGRFEANATFAYVSETAQLAQGTNGVVGSRVAMMAVGGSLCAMPIGARDLPALELWACGGAELEWLVARSAGSIQCDEPGTPSCQQDWTTMAPWLMPRLAFVPTRTLAVVFDVLFAFPLERRRVVAATNSTFTPSPAQVRGGAAFEVRF